MAGNRHAKVRLQSASGETSGRPTPKQIEQDLACLTELGQVLETRPPGLGGATVCDTLIRTLLRIRNKAGLLVPLQLNDSQQQISRKWKKRNIILKARQLGITTYVAARYFVATITNPGTVVVQVAHDQRSAEEIFRMVHRFQENLPETLRQGALVTSRCNVGQLVFPLLDSQYCVASAADANAGRGLTITHLHCSEIGRWGHTGLEALVSLRAAVRPEGEIALESTPNGAGGIFYEEWQRADETGYARHFLPWWLERAYQRNVGIGDPTEEERALMEQCGLDEGQIAYRREIRANFRGLAAQEYAEDAESCFLASGDCVFDVDKIQEKLRGCDSNNDGGAFESRDGGRLLGWWPSAAGRQYIIGVDPAGGGSIGDFACAQVIDRNDGRQCAELHGHFTPAELAARVAELGHEYGDALIAVERNNHGHAVLAHLTAAKYPNLFSQGNQLGWLTSVASRPGMIEQLAIVLAGDTDTLHSPRLLRECRSFVRHPDGSSRAAAGAHDDCVMAMAIALAAKAEAKPVVPAKREAYSGYVE